MKKTNLFILTTLIVAAIGGTAAAQQPAAQQPAVQQPAAPAVPDLSQYILTPKPAETPRINGARVFGVRLGSEFLYTVAATGVRPMTFSVENLPEGLKIDARTGQITGRIAAPGEYTVKLSAKNARGTYDRDLRIVVGDRIALTPPMGWNSWNCWNYTVDQEKILSSARAMVEKGLADHGWTYINIDDTWQSYRGENKAIRPNDKFPDLKKLSQEIHGMGLKLGIYASPWIGTYGGYAGCYSDDADGTYSWIRDGHSNKYYGIWHSGIGLRASMNYRHGTHSFVKEDVKQWGEWGIDYLKYDWKPNDLYHTREMHDALRSLDRDVVYSISNEAPYADAPLWMRYANCWRTTGDITDTWESMSGIGFSQDRWAPFCRPGHWPDPDMMVIGRVGWGPRLRQTQLTVDEQYTHVSLWAMLAAPLLIGCDMAQMDDFTLSLLTNDEVIEVNQDPLGIQAVPVSRQGDQVVYVKHLEDGSMAVGLFNRGAQTTTMGFTLQLLGLYSTQTVRDLWRQKDLTTCADKFETLVAPHGVVLVRVYPGNCRE